MSLRKAAEMVVEAHDKEYGKIAHDVAMEALRQALAQPEQEPVAWGMVKDGLILDVICPEEHAREPGDYTIPLYTAPLKREWVGLTDEELKPLCHEWQIIYGGYVRPFAETIEAKLKEKNT